MDPADREFVRIDSAGTAWPPGAEPGVFTMPLHSGERESVALMKLAPGTRLQPHGHPAGEEILVLEGALEDDDGAYPKGAWLRNPPGSSHAPRSRDGCTFYVKTGHLGE
jgi:anti-sigma factor ChrR (cupin superfamily)